MRWLSTYPPAWAASVPLFIVRLVVGAAFILHGWPKIQNPFGWMDGMGTGTPELLQAVAALIEFGGGILLILGLFTRIVAVGLMAQMIAALAMVHIPNGDPFVAPPGQPSAELAAAYLSVSFLIVVMGPGLWSLDALLPRLSRRPVQMGQPIQYPR